MCFNCGLLPTHFKSTLLQLTSAPIPFCVAHSSRWWTVVIQDFGISPLLPAASESGLQVKRHIAVVISKRNGDPWQASLQRKGVDFMDRRIAGNRDHISP